jgi:hypothetical protein
MEWEEKKSLKSVIAVPAMSQILPQIMPQLYTARASLTVFTQAIGKL